MTQSMLVMMSMAGVVGAVPVWDNLFPVAAESSTGAVSSPTVSSPTVSSPTVSSPTVGDLWGGLWDSVAGETPARNCADDPDGEVAANGYTCQRLISDFGCGASLH